MRGKFLTAWNCPEAYSTGTTIQKERKEWNSQRGERGDGEGVYLSGSERVLRGSRSFGGSYDHKALSYQWPADGRYSFTGYARQAGPKWLKFCLFGLFLKISKCVKFWIWCLWTFELMSLSLLWRHKQPGDQYTEVIFGSFIQQHGFHVNPFLCPHPPYRVSVLWSGTQSCSSQLGSKWEGQYPGCSIHA